MGCSTVRVEIQNPQSKITFYCDKVEFGRKQEYVLYVFFVKSDYMILQFKAFSGVNVSLSQIESTDALMEHDITDPDSEDFFDGFPE